jgi:hypothetical protein
MYRLGWIKSKFHTLVVFLVLWLDLHKLGLVFLGRLAYPWLDLAISDTNQFAMQLMFDLKAIVVLRN